ncbi:hypothetical protein HY772_00640 [Candidatus Woesearchaeota archaeon]|nr:hypothetical protein [Candidatus Woesearchaeota archaeon]
MNDNEGNGSDDEGKNDEKYEFGWARECSSSYVSLTRFAVIRYVAIAVAIGAGIVALERYCAAHQAVYIHMQQIIPSSLEKRCFEELNGHLDGQFELFSRSPQIFPL